MVIPMEVAIQEGPVTCRRCGHEFTGYKISQVEGRQTLLDLDGDVIFELEKVCHFCKTIFAWHTNYRAMVEYSAAFERLMAYYRAKE